MKQKMSKQLSYWLSVIVIGIALGLGLQFVRAWTEPTEAPPNGNVGAPINTGSNTQTKAGALSVGGLSSPSLSDSNDGNYYIDPNGYSHVHSLDTDGAGYISAPWVYGMISTPYICLNGDCRNKWPGPSYSCYQDATNQWYSGSGCAYGYYAQSVYALYSDVYVTSLAITCCAF